MSEPFRVDLDKLRFLQPVAAGMNIYTLASLVPLLRNTREDHDPVLVGPACEACGTRTVLDGRHRAVASVMAGRMDILAVKKR